METEVGKLKKEKQLQQKFELLHATTHINLKYISNLFGKLTETDLIKR